MPPALREIQPTMVEGGVYIFAEGIEFPEEFNAEGEVNDLWDAFADLLIEEFGEDVDLQETHLRTDFFAVHGDDEASLAAAADHLAKNRDIPDQEE